MYEKIYIINHIETDIIRAHSKGKISDKDLENKTYDMITIRSLIRKLGGVVEEDLDFGMIYPYRFVREVMKANSDGILTMKDTEDALNAINHLIFLIRLSSSESMYNCKNV